MSPTDPKRSSVAAAQPAEIGRKRNGHFGAIDDKKPTFVDPGLAAACDACFTTPRAR